MSFDFSYTLQAMPRLLDGALLTLLLASAAILLSLILATALTILRETGSRAARVAINIYISYIRGTPLLVQIFLIFYVLPVVGIDLGPLAAGIIALGMNSAAFTTEIMRGGLSAIPAEQIEAGRSLGLRPFAIWRKVILPQLFRLIIPPLVNELTGVVKGTPLVSVITVVELMRTAQQIYNVNFRPAEVLLGAAILYFAMNFALTRMAAVIERRNALMAH
ncbi:MAG TPA: amino acid ABC transporter permease [Hyphomicrobiaceae bacterium]|nr:amino acid ABC transporter permease [Hyphomicrobiaceae bacterium]